jgi:hypothetical protein
LDFFLKITEVARILEYFFQRPNLGITFDKKMGWATFWATFSPSLLVTLVG